MNRQQRILVFLITAVAASTPLLAALEPAADTAFVRLPDGLALQSSDIIEIAIRVDGEIRLEERLELEIIPPAKALAEIGPSPAAFIEILGTTPALLADLRSLEAAGSSVEVEVRVQGARVASLPLRDARSSLDGSVRLPSRSTSTVQLDSNPWIDPSVLAKASDCVNLCNTIYNGCMSGCGASTVCQNACTQRRNRCLTSCNTCTPATWGTIERVPVSAVPLPVLDRCYKDPWESVGTWYRYGHFVRKSTTTTYTRATDCSVTSVVSVAYDEFDCWDDLGPFHTCSPSVPTPVVTCGSYFVASSF